MARSPPNCQLLSNMKFTKILLIFGLFTLSVIALSAQASRAHIESQLLSESRKMLRTSGWSRGLGVEVKFAGHRCVLSGEVGSELERERLLQLLQKLDGIRELDANGLVVAASTN